MDTDDQIKKKAMDNQARQREWARFAQDTIRIYNPLDIDFRFLYDGFPNTVKAKSYKDVERYKARLFVKKISQYIIGQMQINTGNELIAKRKERGLDEILDKYQESRQIWDKVPKYNDRDLQEKIISQVVVGLVEEYGKEEPLPEQRVLPRNPMDTTQEEIFAKLTKEKIADSTTEPKARSVKPLKSELRIDE